MSVINKIDFLLGDGFLREATEFQKFFKKKLKQYGVNSPADLPANKKKKFFDEVDREYKAKNESLSEATLQSIMMQFGPYATAKKMGILNPKMSGPAGQTAAYPGTGKEHFHPEKQDDKIPTKDKGTVKSYPGSGKEHFKPGMQDTKIPTKDKSVVKSFPGTGKEHFHPDKQDEKIPTKDKGVLKSYPGSGKEHFHPDKQDDKISTKDKGVVKSFPGTGKEHFHPEMQDTKIPTADKGTVKSYPGDSMVRHGKGGIMGFSQMKMMESVSLDEDAVEKLKAGIQKDRETIKKAIADEREASSDGARKQAIARRQDTYDRLQAKALALRQVLAARKGKKTGEKTARMKAARGIQKRVSSSTELYNNMVDYLIEVEEELDDIQKKFGPKKYAEEKGLVDKKKKKTVDDMMKNPNENIYEAYQRIVKDKSKKD